MKKPVYVIIAVVLLGVGVLAGVLGKTLFDGSSSASGRKTADADGDDAAADLAEAVETYDDAVRKAISKLERAWKSEAREYPEMMPEPYVNIKNTRIIRIAKDPVNVQSDNKPIEELEDIDYIIEFLIYTNYFGDTYPSCTLNKSDTVAVYRNGTMTVLDYNVLQALRAKYYITDFSGVIEEIIDLEDTYNGELFGD